MLVSKLIGPPLMRALVNAPFSVADAGQVSVLTEAEALVSECERSVADAKDFAEAAADLAADLSTCGEELTAAERDATVELLMAAEHSFVRALELVVPRARQNVVRAAERDPSLVPLLQRMTELTGEEFRLYIETFRDLRWTLLALQAEAEPPADGPILSTPAAVDDFFRSLRADP